MSDVKPTQEKTYELHGFPCSKEQYEEMTEPTRILRVYKDFDGYYRGSSVKWTLNGKLHRLDGPALEHMDSSTEWYVNGKRHRLDGPAVQCTDGFTAWWVNGKRHRLDGPAVVFANGTRRYYIDGVKYNEADFMLISHLIKESQKEREWQNGLTQTQKDTTMTNIPMSESITSTTPGLSIEPSVVNKLLDSTTVSILEATKELETAKANVAARVQQRQKLLVEKKKLEKLLERAISQTNRQVFWSGMFGVAIKRLAAGLVIAACTGVVGLAGKYGYDHTGDLKAAIRQVAVEFLLGDNPQQPNNK